MNRYRWAGLLPFFLVLGASPSGAQGFRYWDPADSAKAPKTLSATGLYVNLAAGKTMIADAVPFEVNSPLWSDGSAKKRWVLLKAGRSIGFKESDDYWDYPDSAVFIKQFAIDTVPGDSTSRVLWETRFLVNKKELPDPSNPARVIDHWYGFSYRWRADQKEADLVGEDGAKASLRWYPQGRGQPAAYKKWVFPGRMSCNQCHVVTGSDTLHARSVLGFFTAQLNRSSPTNPAKNQLQDLFDRGKLRGTRPADWNKSHRWYGIDSKDTAATLERRSRAYIAANCSGCHGDRGLAQGVMHANLNFDYHLGTPRMQILYYRTGSSFGLEDVNPSSDRDDAYSGVYEVTPGYPQKSVVLFRQRARNRGRADDPDSLMRVLAFDMEGGQMPPLATFEVNEPAMKVIEDWIAGLPKTGNPDVAVKPLAAHELQPRLQGRTLHLPPGWADVASVDLIGLDGRRMALRKTGGGGYAIPAVPPGLYLIQAGNRVFKQLL